MPDIELWNPKPQESSSREHALFPSELATLPKGERLTAKLELIMKDADLNLTLGTYMSQVKLPGMVEQRELTQEQAERIRQAGAETFEKIAEALLTPGQRQEADIAAERYLTRNPVSDLARL